MTLRQGTEFLGKRKRMKTIEMCAAKGTIVGTARGDQVDLLGASPGIHSFVVGAPSFGDFLVDYPLLGHSGQYLGNYGGSLLTLGTPTVERDGPTIVYSYELTAPFVALMAQIGPDLMPTENPDSASIEATGGIGGRSIPAEVERLPNGNGAIVRALLPALPSNATLRVKIGGRRFIAHAAEPTAGQITRVALSRDTERSPRRRR